MNKQVIKAHDVMHSNYLQIDGVATVADALRMMQENKADVIIVNKRNDDDAYGLVMLSDISQKVLAKDKAPDRTNVYEIMTKPVISIEPGLDVRHCARLFDNFGISNAPVIDNGKVLGIVSYNELIFNGLCKLVEAD